MAFTEFMLCNEPSVIELRQTRWLPFCRQHFKLTWWCHQMETFSASLALCVGNSAVTNEFPSQRPVTRSFDVFFDLHMRKNNNKQSRRRWFETPSCSSVWCFLYEYYCILIRISLKFVLKGLMENMSSFGSGNGLAPSPTHCTPVMSYNDTDLGQHWPRWWFVTWMHQAITWTSVHQSGPVTFTSWQFHRKCSRYLFLIWVWNLSI